MKNLPTAEELFKKYSWTAKLDGETLKVVDRQDFLKAIKLYAKLHVEAALKEASDKLYDTYHTVCEDGTTKGVFKTQEEALNFSNTLNNTTKLYHDWVKVVRLDGGMGKSSILNSYPLDKIK